MMRDDAVQEPRPRSRTRRTLVAVALLVGTAGLVGGNTHDVALTRPCVRVLSSRGEPGLPKLGLAQRVWKIQQKC